MIGRGALEALGIDVTLRPGDVAARGNFCTVDAQGALVDRRAGRIPTDVSAPLCQRLDHIEIEGVELDVYSVQDYRFVLRLRGDGLSEALSETDPQQAGVPPLPVKPLEPKAKYTAGIVNEFLVQARQILAEEEAANMVLLRGFAQLPSLPPMGQVYHLDPVGIAAYPMYRGLATVAGMKVIPTGPSFADEVETLRQNFHNHDFFFIHYKSADAAGEDGDFDAKVKCLEELDPFIPQIRELGPDVLMVAGDHSTPAIMAGHSWHPVPLLIHSRWTGGDGVPEFNEKTCGQGPIGRIPATQIMLLALAHAGKLSKFGP